MTIRVESIKISFQFIYLMMRNLWKIVEEVSTNMKKKHVEIMIVNDVVGCDGNDLLIKRFVIIKFHYAY